MNHLTSISIMIYTYLLINICNGQRTDISCNNTETFTGDSAFAGNREQLRYTALTLTENVPADNFFINVSIGYGSNTVYCKAICQADYTAQRCTESINDLLNDLFIECPNQKEATSVGTRSIHYSNRPVLGRLELEPTKVVRANNGGLDSSQFENTTQFYRIWDSLIARVSEIASEKPVAKYATGETYLSEPDRRAIFVFMQCYPDLSPTDCRYCLNKTVSYYRSNLRGNGGGSVQKPSCWFRWEFNRFYQIKADVALPPTPPTKGGISSRTVVFMVVALGCFLLLLTLLYVLYRRKITSNLRYTQDDGFRGINVEAMHFDIHTLRSATDNFSIHNKLGQGGFGTVYKGRLPNGETVAIKRWSEDSTQGEVEFENEVTLMAQLEHRNVVRLLGYCFQQTERLLVYEFVPNQSLDFYIFDPQRCLELDWKKRFKIIDGITRGILYLHQDSRVQIIHRDLKPSNILLDEQMNPKISDFGTAKLFAMDRSQMCTRRIVGTYGYMPPEYAIYGQTSTKSDIFSFGVLVLEIMSGKKVGGNGQSNDNNLLSYAWRNWKEGTPLNVIDKNLLRNGSREEMIRCIHIALLCVQEDLGRRPTMASIVVMLSSHTISLLVPSRPAYLMTATDFDVQPSPSPQFEMTRQSVYEISISELSPR